MISLQSERALAYLKRMPSLAGYSFSIFNPGLTEPQDNMNRMLCSEQGMSHLCGGMCVPFMTAVSGDVLAGGKSVFLRCPRSNYIFVVPISADSCLVCGGELAVDTEEKAQEIILKIEWLIASFLSGKRTQPIDSVQPPIGAYERRHGKQQIRQCQR